MLFVETTLVETQGSSDFSLATWSGRWGKIQSLLLQPTTRSFPNIAL